MYVVIQTAYKPFYAALLLSDIQQIHVHTCTFLGKSLAAVGACIGLAVLFMCMTLYMYMQWRQQEKTEHCSCAGWKPSHRVPGELTSIDAIDVVH